MDDLWKNLESGAIRFSRVISLIGLFGLLLLSLITVGEVVLRSLFNYPILGVSDASQLIVTVVVASCFPLVSAERRHISVKVIGIKSGPRIHALLEAFGAFVVLVFFILFTQQLWRYSQELAAAQETTWLLLWPVAPWWKAVTVLIAICIPNQLICFITSLRSFFIIEKAKD